MMNFLTRYDNPGLTAKVYEARVEQDDDARRALYYEIQRVAEEDAFLLNLYYSPFRNIARMGVEGFHQTPLGRLSLETTRVGN